MRARARKRRAQLPLVQEEEKDEDHEARTESLILQRGSMRHLADWFYPDGGWGWRVVIAAAFIQLLAIGPVLGGGQVLYFTIFKSDIPISVLLIFSTGTLPTLLLPVFKRIGFICFASRPWLCLLTDGGSPRLLPGGEILPKTPGHHWRSPNRARVAFHLLLHAPAPSCHLTRPLPWTRPGAPECGDHHNDGSVLQEEATSGRKPRFRLFRNLCGLWVVAPPPTGFPPWLASQPAGGRCLVLPLSSPCSCLSTRRPLPSTETGHPPPADAHEDTQAAAKETEAHTLSVPPSQVSHRPHSTCLLHHGHTPPSSLLPTCPGGSACSYP